MSNSQAPKRRPGRPKKFTKVTGRQAANLQATRPTSIPISQPGPAIAEQLPQAISNTTGGFYCPPITSSEATFLDAMCLLPSTLRFNETAGSTTHNISLFLDSIPREAPQWRLVDTVRTLDIPYWFDMQLNDYNIKRHNFSELVELTWLGHPQDSPYDPRARPCVVQWKEPSPLGSQGREEAQAAQRVLCRWEVLCRGACAFEPTPVHPEGEEELPPNEDEVVSGRQYAHCREKVKLVLELNAANLNVVHIWQRGSHRDTMVLQELLPSRRLRNEVLTAMRLLGARVSVIMKDIVMKYALPVDNSRPNNTSVVWLHNVPEWRRFTRRQLRTMFANVNKKSRLDEDPLRAIDILAKRNPNKIYYYNAHDRTQPDSVSKFTCAISTNWALENLLLHGAADGIGIDTTWRRMNENRAGVTFITAVDEHGHIAPASALLSANIRTDTLANYLDATEERVYCLAQDIIADPHTISHKSPNDQAAILRECYRTQETGRWVIKKVMIDKCRFLLNAIQKHYPGMAVIICQFHIIQALCRLQGDEGRLNDAPRLTWNFKYFMCIYFREAQRCRTREEWPTYQEKFFRHLERLCLGIMDKSVNASIDGSEGEMSSASEADDEGDLHSDTPSMPVSKKAPKTNHFGWLKKYFLENWFSELWLPHVTDIGLPPGGTRDGTSNTNNPSESAILVFGKVFLDCRVNKRLDRLAAIIMNEWFPFYEYWPSESRNPPVEIQLMIARAHKLWDQGMVRELDTVEVAAAQGTAPMYRVQEAIGAGHYQACIVDLKIPRCSCRQWTQTGKWCVHMRAVQLLRANGPVYLWQEQEYQIQKSMGTRTLTSKPKKRNNKNKMPRRSTRRPPSDHVLDRQVERLIHKLACTDTRSSSTQPGPGFSVSVGHGMPSANVGVQPPQPLLSISGRHPQETLPVLPTAGLTTASPGDPSSQARSAISHPPVPVPVAPTDGFRSGWSQAGGRPRVASPLFPTRARRRKTISFSKKRGRKGAVRLSRNSVILRSWGKDLGRRKPGVKQRLKVANRVLQAKVLRVKKTRKEKDGHNPNGSRPVSAIKPHSRGETANERALLPGDTCSVKQSPTTGRDDNPALTNEDTSIFGTDFSRWNEPYQLRIEEMELIIEMLNALALHMNLSWWCFISGGAHQDRVISEILTSSSPGHKTMNEFAQRLLSYHIYQRDRIFFLDLTSSHWTVWEYYLAPEEVSCTGYNPMAHRGGLERVNRLWQVSICNALRLRRWEICGDSTGPRPALIQLPDVYNAQLTGLQSQGDATSCGFWCAIIVICRIMGISDILASLAYINVLNIQHLLATLWAPFLSDEQGIRGIAFVDVARTLGADDYWLMKFTSDIDAVVAPRPAYMARIEPPVSLRYPATWGQKLSDADLYVRICAGESVRITFPGFQLGHSEITQLKNIEGRLQSSMISGYLSLYTHDQRNMDWTGLTLPFFIFDVTVTLVMSQQKTMLPFKPRDTLNTWKFWAPQVNIFILHYVFLPWHITSNEHWILVIIRPRQYQITIHDSLTHKLSRMHQHICNRVYKFVQYEHHTRFGTPLPEQWQSNLQRYYNQHVVACPLQLDEYSCGLIVIALISAVCEGMEPEDIAELTQDEILNVRERILIRLAREWEYIEDDVTPMVQTDFHTEHVPLKEVSQSNSPTHHHGDQDCSASTTLLPFNLQSPHMSPDCLRSTPLPPHANVLVRRPIEMPCHYVPNIGASALWRPSLNDKYCPVFVVGVSVDEELAQIEIPSGVVDDKGVVALESRIYAKTFGECEEIFALCVGEIYPEEVAPIIWPELLDDRKLQETLEEHEHQLDAIRSLSVQQREAISVMREHIPLIITSINGDNTVFPGLVAAWEQVVRGPGYKMARVVAFADRHLQLLDVQMRCIIQTVAYHELAPWIPDGTEKLTDYLASCMLAYVVLGYELNMSPQDVYRDALEELITRPVSSYEKMWLTMETCTTLPGPAQKWPQNKANFIASHRISFPIGVPELIHHAAGKTDDTSKTRQETPDEKKEGHGNVISSPHPSYGLKPVDMAPVEEPGNSVTTEDKADLAVTEPQAGARNERKGRKRGVKGGAAEELVQLETRKKLRKRG